MFKTGAVGRGLAVTMCLAAPLMLGTGCDGETPPAPDTATQAGGVLGGPITPIAGTPGPTAGSTPIAPPGGSGITPGAPNASGGAPGGEFPGGGPEVAPPTAASQFCDVLPVIQRNCQNCHGAEQQAGAPMPLVTYDDLMASAKLTQGKKVVELLSERLRGQRPMPPAPAVMSDADKALIDGWVAAGAPAGVDPTCGGTDIVLPPVGGEEEEKEWPADCEDHYTLVTSSRTNPSDPYLVRGDVEEHPQFIFDAPWGNDPVQVVATRSITDNAGVLHHWIMYENGGFGGKFLVGWAPGKKEGKLPDNVGIYMPSGPQSLRLDVHYYNRGNAQDELDQSGIELCVTRNFREFTATVIGLTGNATAPANQRVDNATSCTASVNPGSDVRFLSVSPHMHKLGVHGKLELTRNGENMVVHDAPFAFEDQTVWPLDNLQIQDGDVLTTTCSFENNTGRTVTFGNNSDNEMCFNFVLYYPMGELTCGLSL